MFDADLDECTRIGSRGRPGAATARISEPLANWAALRSSVLPVLENYATYSNSQRLPPCQRLIWAAMSRKRSTTAKRTVGSCSFRQAAARINQLDAAIRTENSRFDTAESNVEFGS